MVALFAPFSTSVFSLWKLDLPHFKGEHAVKRNLGEKPDDPGKISYRVERLDNLPDDCGECILQILKDGGIVHEESNQDCPEVEILDDECELSDRYQVIKVEKQSNLQRVEVRDQDIVAYGIGGSLIDASPLPDECLNIYRTFVTAPPFPSNNVPIPATHNPYEFVAQICSAEGCPPPKYNVVCSCGEECPTGTCPVFCGNHVCCHDPNTGNSVYQIPIGEYSGGNS